MNKLILGLVIVMTISTTSTAQNSNFSSSGFHITNDPYFIDCAVRQPDGKILISGTFNRYHNKPVANLLRFNSDGQRDTSFNLNTGTNNTIFAVSAHADGSILLAGNFTQYQKQNVDFPIIRVAANGARDLSFQPQRSGIRPYSIADIMVLPDGKVLVAGWALFPDQISGSAIVRLNKDGSLDQTFKQNICDEYIVGIRPGPDGTVLVYGNFKNWNNSPVTGLIRLKSNGDTDPGFALEGTGLRPFYSYESITISRLVVLPDSSLLIAGYFDY